MKYLKLTLPTPEANLACDEALLDELEAGRGEEVLRCWESRTHFAVVGYANHVAREVDLEACRKHGIPVLRRCSGGGTVLQGPGCLSYALILRTDETGPLATISGTNRYVMDRLADIFRQLLQAEVRVQGHTDLVLGEVKFSGNAQRRRRRALLFHGTFLLSFDLSLIQAVLPLPTKEPAYRRRRPHTKFLANLELSSAQVAAALREAWSALEPLSQVPLRAIERLVAEKYSRDDWNRKF